MTSEDLTTAITTEPTSSSRSSAAFGWAFANAILFTIYIVLAHGVARVDPSTNAIDRLGAAMVVAGLMITPVGLGLALPALIDPIALGAGFAVGVTSSVIPYVFDQMACGGSPAPPTLSSSLCCQRPQ